jgi:hypothetical protein
MTDLAGFMAAPVPRQRVLKAVGDYVAARQALNTAVAAAVYRGATWADIGAWLGITAEMAEMRFTEKPKEKR